MFLDRPETAYGLRRQLPAILSEALLLAASMGILLYMAGCRRLFPFVLPGIALLIGLWVWDVKRTRAQADPNTKAGRRSLPALTAACIAGLLLVVLLIWHQILLDGFGLIMNRLYGIAEQAQSYLYDRFQVSAAAEQQTRYMQAAVLWGSGLAGALTALIPSRMRSWVCTVLGILVLLCFAYFGILPGRLWTGIFLLALVLVAAGSLREGAQDGFSILTGLLPLLLALAIVFTGITLLDPGENQSVSRADETLRDRLAVHTVRLEGMESAQAQSEQERTGDAGAGSSQEKKSDPAQSGIRTRTVLLLILLTLLVLFVPAILRDRLRRKQQRLRAGLDSADPAEAVRAIFPYALRWLQLLQIKVDNRTFAAFGQQVIQATDAGYGTRYTEALALWQRAAYSDHDISQEELGWMREFLQETERLVGQRIGVFGRLRARLLVGL